MRARVRERVQSKSKSKSESESESKSESKSKSKSKSKSSITRGAQFSEPVPFTRAMTGTSDRAATSSRPVFAYGVPAIRRVFGGGGGVRMGQGREGVGDAEE